MKTISTEDQRSVKQLARFTPYSSYLRQFAEQLIIEGYEGIIHCNGITMGRKGNDIAWYSDRKGAGSIPYGPVKMSTITDHIDKQTIYRIKKVLATKNNFVFLTEAGKVYDLKASVLHGTKNLHSLKMYFRWIDVPDSESVVDIETSSATESVILMKTEGGKVYAVGSNKRGQLAKRDDTYGMRVANLVYEVKAGAFAAGYDFSICSTDNKILVCGDNTDQKLGTLTNETLVQQPTVAIEWSPCFGKVESIVGLLDLIVIRTKHHVYVAGKGDSFSDDEFETFRVLDLPTTPKAIYGNANSNVFYITTVSDVFICNVRNDSDVNSTKKVPFLDNPPICVACGKETYPTLTFVNELVYVVFDNRNVASSMSRLFDYAKEKVRSLVYSPAYSEEPSAKRFKAQMLVKASYSSIPFGDLVIVTQK